VERKKKEKDENDSEIGFVSRISSMFNAITGNASDDTETTPSTDRKINEKHVTGDGIFDSSESSQNLPSRVDRLNRNTPVLGTPPLTSPASRSSGSNIPRGSGNLVPTRMRNTAPIQSPIQSRLTKGSSGQSKTSAPIPRTQNSWRRATVENSPKSNGLLSNISQAVGNFWSSEDDSQRNVASNKRPSTKNGVPKQNAPIPKLNLRRK